MINAKHRPLSLVITTPLSRWLMALVIAVIPASQLHGAPQTTEPRSVLPADPEPEPTPETEAEPDQTPVPADPPKAEASPLAPKPRARRTRRGSSVQQFSKRADGFVALFKPVVAAAGRSVVQIYSGGKQLSLGLIVDADGLILTKASELKGEIKCRLPGGKLLAAEVFGIHTPTDLALLKVRASSLEVVEFATDPTPLIGQWVASPLPDQQPLIGIVSAKTREIPASTPFMGIIMAPLTDRDGVRITTVISKSPADEAGLWVNDVIVKIDDVEISDMQSIRDALGQYDPDDRITITAMRGETEKRIKLTLAEKDKISPMNRRSNQQNSMGSHLSRRRKAFPNAFQHDSMLDAKNCGGPLVNLQGQVIGVNIARAGRVASYSLPVSTIGPIIDQLKTGELAPAIVNKDAIAKLDTERQEQTNRLGDLLDRKNEEQRKLAGDEIRLNALNEILEDVSEKVKAQEAANLKRRKTVNNVDEDIRRSKKDRSRLDSKRKLLSTGRQ